MAWWTGRKYFKNRTRRISGVDRLPKTGGPMLFAGIQAVGGAALAYYLFDDPTYRILPYMCSAVAVVGTYNVLKIMQKDSRKAKNLEKSGGDCDRILHRSAWNLATGTFTYFTNVYAFSEGLKLNDKMWIPSLAVAASGYYFAASFINSLETGFNRNTFLICCQRMFEPALIASAAIYLLLFRNHEEECLYWLPFVFIASSGNKTAFHGIDRVENEMVPQQLLLKAIEMLMGGCLLTISGIVLTVYTSVNDFNMLCVFSASLMSLFGAFLTFGSITCFRRYVGLDRDVFFSIVGMIAGPITFLASCLMVKCVQDTHMVYFICLFLGGFGHIIVFKSVLNLYVLVPKKLVYRYCQRVLGPVLTVYSCLATAFVGYRMGWRFSLVMMPFIPVGMYATYKGFRSSDELSDSKRRAILLSDDASTLRHQ